MHYPHRPYQYIVVLTYAPPRVRDQQKNMLFATLVLIAILRISQESVVQQQKILVDRIVFERLCRYLSFKHHIQLFISSAFHLRDTKITPYQTRDAESTEEEPKLATQVGRVRVDQVRNSDSHDDAEHSLNSGSDCDGL